MTQIQQIPIFVPLAVGGVAVFCTVLIHAMPQFSMTHSSKILARGGTPNK